MRHTPFAVLSALVLSAGLGAAPALASNLPGADQQGAVLSVGLGLANGIGFDADLTPTTRWGVQIGNEVVGMLAPRVGLRVLQKLPVPGPIHVGILGTVDGSTFWDNGPGAWSTIGPSAGLGLALAWTVTPSLALRANLADILILYPAVSTAPMSTALNWETGVEVGYRFTPQLEGTLGITGLGQVVGVKYHL